MANERKSLITLVEKIGPGPAQGLRHPALIFRLAVQLHAVLRNQLPSSLSTFFPYQPIASVESASRTLPAFFEAAAGCRNRSRHYQYR